MYMEGESFFCIPLAGKLLSSFPSLSRPIIPTCLTTLPNLPTCISTLPILTSLPMPLWLHLLSPYLFAYIRLPPCLPTSLSTCLYLPACLLYLPAFLPVPATPFSLSSCPYLSTSLTCQPTSLSPCLYLSACLLYLSACLPVFLSPCHPSYRGHMHRRSGRGDTDHACSHLDRLFLISPP